MCQCEDRPCCGCVSIQDSNDLNNYDPEAYQNRSEENDNTCSVCAQEFTDEDDEDDLVSGFHNGCGEDYEPEYPLDVYTNY